MKKIYSYLLGFTLSITLTLVAFGINGIHSASGHIFPTHEQILPTIIGLALVQLVVQLVFFLHLGQGEKPKWKLVAFILTIVIVAILVGGTLWIMQNLQYSHEHSYDVFDEENIHPATHAH
jgi:cytochrome o ubiquinol oxidase operon protein cyoD